MYHGRAVESIGYSRYVWNYHKPTFSRSFTVKYGHLTEGGHLIGWGHLTGQGHFLNRLSVFLRRTSSKLLQDCLSNCFSSIGNISSMVQEWQSNTDQSPLDQSLTSPGQFSDQSRSSLEPVYGPVPVKSRTNRGPVWSSSDRSRVKKSLVQSFF